PRDVVAQVAQPTHGPRPPAPESAPGGNLAGASVGVAPPLPPAAVTSALTRPPACTPESADAASNTDGGFCESAENTARPCEQNACARTRRASSIAPRTVTRRIPSASGWVAAHWSLPSRRASSVA